ncbi:MAG: hypothetical protein ACE5JX_06940 [Acidobacteriota bacterium]
MLVVTSSDRQGEKYRDVAFRLDDSCAHCSKKIEVEIKNGEVTSLNPDTVYVQQGGG